MIFETGRAKIDGRANFLEKPFPGAAIHFTADNVPLSAFGPGNQQINLEVRGGHLSTRGLAEYSPRVTRIELDKATIDEVSIGYVHKASTQQAEARRVKATGQQIEKQNNRPAVDISVREFDVIQSNLSHTDETKVPRYRLTLSDTNITLKNLSNQRTQGPAILSLRGKFMGSGDTLASATFLASQSGPAFNANIAIRDTDLPSMNDSARLWSI